jgi:catechol 2,3-dioxygenase-like lactoylglutathione lyase family enzyme
LERSIRWYEGVLGLERAFADLWASYPAVLLAGKSGVALFPSRGEPIQTPATLNAIPHIGFVTSRSDFEAAREQLESNGIEYREMDHKVAWSLYLLDPDGYLIGITTYEALA